MNAVEWFNLLALKCNLLVYPTLNIWGLLASWVIEYSVPDGGK